jgi:hypothetical protein
VADALSAQASDAWNGEHRDTPVSIQARQIREGLR